MRPGRPSSGFTIFRILLSLAAAALVLSPILRDPTKGWPLGPARRLAFGLTLVTLLVYAVRRRRDGESYGRHPLDLILLGALPFYALQIGNGGILTSGDNYATRALGVAIVKDHSLDVAPYPPFPAEPDHYSVVLVDGRKLPAFPLGTGLLSVPYVAVALAATPGPVTDLLLSRWERHFSALVGCGASLLFFLALRQRLTEQVAVTAAAIFATATNVLSSVGQAMWSTSGEVLCLTLALYLLFGELPRPWHRSFGGGLALAAAFACRPTALVAAAAMAAAAIYEDRRSLKPLLYMAGLGVVAVSLFQFELYGNLLGGYGLLNLRAAMWGDRTLEGLAGNLLSPSRGILVFFPYVLFLALGWKTAVTRGFSHWWLAAATALLGTVALASCYEKWWGGASLGPRLLTEAAPFMAFLTVPLLLENGLRGLRLWSFRAAVLFAAATQVLLIYNPAANRWTGEVDLGTRPELLWSVRDSQLAAAWGIRGRT